MRTPGAANWTAELEDQLRQLWANGESAARIAAAMGGGLTRNSIIGKASRMKLPKRRGTVARMAPRRVITKARNAAEMSTSVKLGAARKAGAQSLDEALQRIRPTPRAIAGSTWDALPDTTPIPLLIASDAACRWPVGDPLEAGFGFCGCPVDEGSVYCPTHRAVGTTTFKATAADKRKLEKMDMSRRVFS